MKEDCIEDVTITVFPAMPGIGIIEEDPVSTDDACGDPSPTSVSTDSSEEDTVVITLGSKDPMEKINQLLRDAKSKYGGSICIRVAKYGTKEQLEDSIEWLNSALRGSGDNTVMDAQKFSSFIGASAPIITINNRLSFVGSVPNKPQFLSRIGAALRIAQGK
ncbi:MAG: hypothetical protein ACFE7R_03980 [Candidatus Hodarchaeota archaeon]